MKVGVIAPGGVDPSGTHRVIPALLWLLERISARHDVHVFAMRGDAGRPRYRLRGATIHAVAGGRRRTLPTLRALLREHRQGRFDILHAFWVTGPGVVAALAGPLLRRPVLLHIPGGDLVALPEIGYGGRLRFHGRLRARLALTAATRLTAPCSATCDMAARLGHHAERLPLGVSRDEWPPRLATQREPGEPARLVHVGSLNRVKDQATLLRAARRLADRAVDFTLDIIGVDTLGGVVQKLAGELGLHDRVRFYGFLPQEELRPLVARAHLMLVSSRHEGRPVAASEAAMLGVPTVGTAVGQLREWAPDAAAVVPVGDHVALAEEAFALLEDDARRRRMGEAARAIAMAEDADWSAERILGLYQTLADR